MSFVCSCSLLGVNIQILMKSNSSSLLYCLFASIKYSDDDSFTLVHKGGKKTLSSFKIKSDERKNNNTYLASSFFGYCDWTGDTSSPA